MRLVDVDPDDEGQVETLTRMVEDVRLVDDPHGFTLTVEDTRLDLRHGRDLHPEPFVLLVDDDGVAVGHLWLDAPVRDNLHLVVSQVVVHPDHRRRGHGTRLLDEVVRRANELGRTTLWMPAAADDLGATAFLEGHGFSRASTDVRRHQRLADLDPGEIDRLETDAAAHAADYVLERLDPPYDDALLESLLAATAAINDAPMGSLTFEEEVYDLDRMRDYERARALRGERFRRVVARHRTTGEVAGHTFLVVRPWAAHEGIQFETAVAHSHRGHRLGIALKIAMMRWLAETEPDLQVVVTSNNVENTPMIRVNEALGYRFSRAYAMFQRVLRPRGDG